MKKLLFIALTVVLAITIAACGKKDEPTPSEGENNNNEVVEVTLTVAASPVPHAEILNSLKDTLKEQGVNLVVKEFTDYVQPNVQVFEKQLDANFFQHTPYLDEFNADHSMDLVTVVGTHIEPFGAYSLTIDNIEDLKDGAAVAIPNDPTNGGRALALLADNNLITLTDGVGVAGTVKDIIDNPKNLDFKELEAAMLPRVLDEVDLALINTNYALEADLVPTEDALFIEASNSPYVNILVARPDNKDSDAITKLAEALTSEATKQFIEEKYEGSVVPAF